MTPIEIVSTANPRLRALLAERERRFFLAGDKLVRDLLARPLRVDKLLLRADLAAPPPAAAAVGETWRVSAAVMRKAAAMPDPPPLLAVVDLPAAVIDFTALGLVVGLVDVQDPGNLGTIFRCAAAFDIPALALAGACARVNGAKFLRAAQTAVLDVPFQVFACADELVDAALRQGVRVYATGSRPPGLHLAVDQVRPPALLLMGNEGQGLAPRFLERFPMVCLEQSQRIDSLNVGVSACILMRELGRRSGR